MKFFLLLKYILSDTRVRDRNLFRWELYELKTKPVSKPALSADR
ncbi:MAG TPA: hypothetical protein VMU83_10050 [Hanamia sp.]|nr:hypothetical protein [Hanamia sp.]